jgi:hypothetical protein
VQTVQVSAHADDSRRLLQTGDEGLVRAGRLRAWHADDFDRPRQTDDEIEMPGGQAGMLQRRRVMHARTGVVRDERTQRECWRGNGVVWARHRSALSQTLVELVASLEKRFSPVVILRARA